MSLRRAGSSLKKVSNAPPAEVSDDDGGNSAPREADCCSASRRSIRNKVREIPATHSNPNRATPKSEASKITTVDEVNSGMTASLMTRTGLGRRKTKAKNEGCISGTR